MNIPILNRDAAGHFALPADGWFQLVPKGEFLHAQTGWLQVLDEAALTAMADEFTAQSSQANFPGRLVDFDHFSYDPDKSSTAAGWITGLQSRADGLWGRIRWTGDGLAALQRGDFRFLSPVWLAQDCEVLPNFESQNPQLNFTRAIRPRRLDTVGLTNHPNLKGMAPLSNRASPHPGLPGQAGERAPASSCHGGAEATQSVRRPNAAADHDPVGIDTGLRPWAGGSATNQERKTKTKETMNQINQALGLAVEAAPDAALAEISKLKNRASDAEARAVSLAKQNQELLADQVESDLNTLARGFAPEVREKWKAALLKNRAETLALLRALPAPQESPSSNGKSQGPLHNRHSAKTPENHPCQTAEERAGEQRKAVGEYKNRLACSWQQAWLAVRAERPELFQER